ncbi:MAG: molybdenum cofactor biosynthesis protein MoaE [Myxococcales bacterium]|nr:molybdenum cofactor biosynthesis protein MoaE [Myxococcales bacterium]
MVTHPIALEALIAAVTHPGAGAVATFLGTVRDTNEGRSVTSLEYHVYERLADTELRAIVADVELELPGVRVACEHRTGVLAVGDVAVACAASAAHRAEAFEACRRLIDRIKARVPIWKREHGPDGPYWVGWQDARCSPDDDHDQHHLP